MSLKYLKYKYHSSPAWLSHAQVFVETMLILGRNVKKIN